MSFDARVYRVMIASPSDTTEERAAVRRLIEDYNDQHSATYQCIILPFMWEQEVAASSGESPQDSIDRQGIYGDVDVLVGFFRLKFGQKNGAYRCATEREIETFRQLGGGRAPAVLFYDGSKDAKGEQAELIRAYKNELQKRSDGGIVGSYKDAFDGAIRIMKAIQDQIAKLEDQRAEKLRRELEEQKSVPVKEISRIEAEQIRAKEKTMNLALNHSADLIDSRGALEGAKAALSQFADQLNVLNVHGPMFKYAISNVQAKQSDFAEYATHGWSFHRSDDGRNWVLENVEDATRNLRDVDIRVRPRLNGPFQEVVQQDIEKELKADDFVSFPIPPDVEDVAETAAIAFTYTTDDGDIQKFALLRLNY